VLGQSATRANADRINAVADGKCHPVPESASCAASSGRCA
jgi:hypothetical protein